MKIFENDFVCVQSGNFSFDMETTPSQVNIKFEEAFHRINIESFDRDTINEICDRLGMPEPQQNPDDWRYPDLYKSSASSLYSDPDKQLTEKDVENAKEVALDVTLEYEREDKEAIKEVLSITTMNPYEVGGIFDGNEHSCADLIPECWKNANEDFGHDYFSKLEEATNGMEYSQEIREAATAILLTTREESVCTKFYDYDREEEREETREEYFLNPYEALDKMQEARDLVSSGEVVKISIPSHEVVQDIRYELTSEELIKTCDILKDSMEERTIRINDISMHDRLMAGRYLDNHLDHESIRRYGDEVVREKIDEWSKVAGHKITNVEFKKLADEDKDITHGKMLEEDKIRNNMKEIGDGFYIAEGYNMPRVLPYSGQEFSLAISDVNGKDPECGIGFQVNSNLKDSIVIDRFFDKEKGFSTFRDVLDANEFYVSSEKETYGTFVEKIKELSQEIEKSHEKEKDKDCEAPSEEKEQEKEISIGGR